MGSESAVKAPPVHLGSLGVFLILLSESAVDCGVADNKLYYGDNLDVLRRYIRDDSVDLVRTPFAIAGVLLIIFVIYGYNASQRANPNPAVTPIERLTKQQHTTTLANPALKVNALNFAYFKLDVPAGATSVLVHGNFTASGGLGNDVEVFLLSESDFVNWQNRHDAKTFYNSGKVTVGNLNVNLPADAGTYYLVFSNRFGLLAQKSVRVDAALTYYQ
jgi:hypothetical protein